MEKPVTPPNRPGPNSLLPGFARALDDLTYHIFENKPVTDFKMGLQGIVPAGVVTGENLLKLMNYCKADNNINSIIGLFTIYILSWWNILTLWS